MHHASIPFSIDRCLFLDPTFFSTSKLLSLSFTEQESSCEKPKLKQQSRLSPGGRETTKHL